jgi:hypothetical protein
MTARSNSVLYSISGAALHQVLVRHCASENLALKHIALKLIAKEHKWMRSLVRRLANAQTAKTIVALLKHRQDHRIAGTTST